MTLLLIPWLAAALAAAPDPSPDATDDAPTTADPARAFDEARDRYLSGDIEGARAAFQEVVALLDAGDDTDPTLWAEALVFLGEIAYLAGRREAADASFRLVAQHLPSYRPSPYDHPDDVVGAYEIARSAVAEMALDATGFTPPTRPLPWWGYAPFGVPQFKQGRPVRGALYATLQIGAAAASIGAWVAIDRELAGFDRLDDDEQVETRRRASLYRDAWSIPAATAFYALWGISALDGGLSWRRDLRAPEAIAIVPRRDGAMIQAAWRF